MDNRTGFGASLALTHSKNNGGLSQEVELSHHLVRVWGPLGVEDTWT